MQLLYLVSKNKKKLIYGLLALFVGQVCFFNLWWIGIWNEVYAAETPTLDASFQDKVSGWFQTISFLQKVVYIVTYPLLIVASKLVDNSLVYWEVFWFDAVLWQLWVIIRNLANFALWFIFLFYICKYLLTGDTKKGPKWIILRSLIAWIWIQASWFLMAVLIDLSTILTYAVWWLPITILWSNVDKEDSYDPNVLKTVMFVDTNNADTINTYLTNVDTWTGSEWEKFYISECRTKYYSYSASWGKEELIVAPKMIYYKDELNNYNPTVKNKCHYYGKVYYFNKILLEDEFKTFPGNATGGDWENGQNSYSSALNTLVHKMDDSNEYSLSVVTSYVSNGQLLQIWNAHKTWWVIWGTNINVVYWSGQRWGLDEDNQWLWTWTAKLSSILDGDSFVWVFSSLYFSLLNAWNSIISSDGGIYLSFLSVALSFLHMMAVGIPLIAMAVVFIMRIGVIWMAIALSPFIVLLKVFDLEDKIFKKDSILESLSLENLLFIIFSPVFICFAASMSTVLVRLIDKMNYKSIDTGEPILWFIQIDLGGLWIWLWKLIIAVMWVAITWFLMWFAIELSKLWNKKGGIVQSMKNLATTALMSAPVVPIPWKDWKWTVISPAWLKQWIDKVSSNIKSTFEEQDVTAIENWLDPEKVKKEWEKTQITTYLNKLDDFVSADLNWAGWSVRMWEKWKQEFKFDSFEDAQKNQIIKSINEMGEEKRKRFGWSKTLKVWDKIFEFKWEDAWENKYKYIEVPKTWS